MAIAQPIGSHFTKTPFFAIAVTEHDGQNKEGISQWTE
ncbi:hypothetical protein W909_16025 [Dickeya zeae EC1]|nr:hypothetical protein W909_16025 [Dickeya zeae EC1]